MHLSGVIPVALSVLVFVVPQRADATPCPVPSRGQTEFEAAAENLSEGEYCYYETTLTGGDLDPGGSTVIQWTDSGAWRPGARELHWIGRANGCNNEARPYMHIVYDEVSGVSTIDATDFNPCGHGYDHNTVDPETDTYYFRPFGSDTIARWEDPGWSNLPAFSGYTNSAAALTFFPEMGEQGRLIVVTGSRLRLFDGAAWTEIELPVNVGTLHNVAEYNPVLAAVVFGGGNNAPRVLYRLDADGTLTQLGEAPFDLGSNGAGGGMLTVDPLSGRMLGLDKATGQWWDLDLEADTWQQTNTPPPVSVGSTFQAPISTWGLIALFEDDAGEDEPARLWVYKHSAGEPPGPGDDSGDGDSGDSTGADDTGPGGVDDGPAGDDDTSASPGDDMTPGDDATVGVGGSTGSSGSAADDDSTGCSCRSGAPPSWALLLAVLGPWIRRRRRC